MLGGWVILSSSHPLLCSPLAGTSSASSRSAGCRREGRPCQFLLYRELRALKIRGFRSGTRSRSGTWYFYITTADPVYEPPRVGYKIPIKSVAIPYFCNVIQYIQLKVYLSFKFKYMATFFNKRLRAVILSIQNWIQFSKGFCLYQPIFFI